MNYEQALTHAGLTPDVRYHQLYLQGQAAGMAQAREVMTVGLEALEELNNTNSYWWQEVDENVVVQLGNAETALREALEGKEQP